MSGDWGSRAHFQIYMLIVCTLEMVFQGGSCWGNLMWLHSLTFTKHLITQLIDTVTLVFTILLERQLTAPFGLSCPIRIRNLPTNFGDSCATSEGRSIILCSQSLQAKRSSCCLWIHVWFVRCRHLHQRVEEHKHSVIGTHFLQKRNLKRMNLNTNLKVLKKCRGKLECLIFEILTIRNNRPTLNTQADSIRGKLFI